MRKLILGLIITSLVGCNSQTFDVNKQLDYCTGKVSHTIKNMPVMYSHMPRNIEKGKKQWHYVDVEDWTSGFWPGILWYTYEYAQNDSFKAVADSFTMALTPVIKHKAENHDLGFMIYLSFGNGFRLTQNPLYKQAVLQASDSLAVLFNKKVGTILSWPSMTEKKGWPHNTIIDNMMNLEMLYWSSANSKDKWLYNIADKHAYTTMQNQFRNDNSCYHVVVYDTITGKKIKGLTHQGYSDSSMWARGQAWAIYGFTMCYRETQRLEFLDQAREAAKIYIKRLPKDYIPYWDFDASDIPDAPKDVSAAAITASALLEMSVLDNNKEEALSYRKAAEKMLENLSSDKYLSGDENAAFLLHSTGHKPKGTEIDASIIYADYYYLEALIRLKKLQEGKSIYQNL